MRDQQNLPDIRPALGIVSNATDPMAGSGVPHRWWDGTTLWEVDAAGNSKAVLTSLQLVAGETITVSGAPLCARVHSDGKMYKVDNSEAKVQEFAGFVAATVASAATGSFLPAAGIVGGFSGLTIGAEYYTSSTSAVSLWSALSTGDFARRVGTAISATQILASVGDVTQK